MEEKKYRCVQCDKFIDEGVKVCPYCGLNFEDESPVDNNYNADDNKDPLNIYQYISIFLGCIGIIAGIYLGSQTEIPVLGFTYVVASVISAIFLYGFGTIINNTEQIKKCIRKMSNEKNKKKK